MSLYIQIPPTTKPLATGYDAEPYVQIPLATKSLATGYDVEPEISLVGSSISYGIEYPLF